MADDIFASGGDESLQGSSGEHINADHSLAVVVAILSLAALGDCTDGGAGADSIVGGMVRSLCG